MYTKIYDFRTKMHMNQEKLSELTGVSQSQISKYEKGEVTRPSYEKLVRIADALGCSVDDITDKKNEKTNTAFESYTTTTAGVFIALFSEGYKANKDFQHGDGFIMRRGGQSQQQIRKPSFVEYSASAYAVTTYSTSMTPRYKSGDILFVDPTSEAQVGDDVCVIFKRNDDLIGLVREVSGIKEDGWIEVKELSSGEVSSFKMQDLYAVHLVVGMQKFRN